MEAYFLAWVLGAAGSLHCVGMCGPIALALPVHHLGFPSRLLFLFLFHSGRIAVYALMGGLFSFIGAGFFLAGYQQALSIILGIALILLGAFSSKIPAFSLSRYTGGFLKLHFSRFLGKRTPLAFLITGMLNGLLPCGMVYAALAGATLSTSPAEGMLFMAFFGLGTAPALMSISLLTTISAKLRFFFRKASPVLTFIMGVLLVIRGLGLGIPLLSPANSGDTPAKECAQPLEPTSNEQEPYQ